MSNRSESSIRLLKRRGLCRHFEKADQEVRPADCLLRWLYRRRLTIVTIMRIHTLLVRFFTFVVCTAASFCAQDDGINWLGDYREAILQAKQTQKPIFLEFRCEA